MSTPAWTLVDAGTLAQLLQDTNPLVLDCRFSLADPGLGRRQYEAGHIPGAHHADLDTDLSGPRVDPALGRHPLPAAAAFARSLGRWGWQDGRTVIACDDGSGAIAARAWWLLRMLGQPRVAVLDGGIAAWEAAGLPLVRELPAAGSEVPRVEFDMSRVLLIPQLERELAGGATPLLLDARTRERFHGENETLDPVGGHVPGAHSRPLAENLEATGRFKTPAKLHAEFTALLGNRAPHEVVHSCGSGVTACHNLLAMEHAGLTGSRLFAPSWSGWCSDPHRPVATA